MLPPAAPYVHDRPIDEPGLFVGRHDLAEEITGRARRGESFAVLGGTRLGKTSLLLQVRDRIERQPETPTGQRVVPVFLSTHQFGRLTRAALLASVLEELGPHLQTPDPGAAAAAVQSLRSGEVSQDFAFDHFFARLRELLTADPEVQLFVMLDEVDELRNEDWSKALFANLRFLISQSALRQRVHVIIAGTLHSADLWNTAGSPFYNVVTLVEMRLVEDDDLRRLIGIGFPDGLSDETERALLTEAGGHPYLMQYLLGRLWERPGGSAPDRATVEAAGRQFLRERKGDFQRWWGACGDDARTLFREIFASRDRLKKRTAIEIYDGDVDRAEEALDQLVVNGVVREVARNRFQAGSKLFARWAMARIGSPRRNGGGGPAAEMSPGLDGTAGEGPPTAPRPVTSWRETAELPLPTGLGELLALWRGRRDDPARLTPPFHQRLGRQLLRIGEPLVAYDVFSAGLERWPEDRPLRQLLGQALANAGATHRARVELQALVDDGYSDGATLGSLARVHRQLAEREESANRDRHLAEASRLYELGLRLALEHGRTEEALACGSRAAALACLRGDEASARQLAQRAHDLGRELLGRLEAAGEDPFSARAALGQASLIQGDLEAATAHYLAAAEAGHGRYAEIGGARRQAMALLVALGHSTNPVDDVLRVPPVALFRGHPIDAPGRASVRFPPRDEDAIAREIDRLLERIGPAFGFVSPTCGADLLFAEALLRRRAELHLVLPCPADEFRAARVERVPGAGWGERFDRIMREATSIEVLGERHALQNRAALEYSARVTLGLALLKARALGAELAPMAVWDGLDDPDPASTAATLGMWRDRGLPVDVIPLPSSAAPAALSDAPDPTTTSLDVPDHRIVGLLFADAVHFSRLDDVQVKQFADKVYGAVAEMVDRSPHAPAVKNTWGDALYMVFLSVVDAGRFALDLADYFAATDWAEAGLPEELSVRIGLHAGPTHAVTDPLTGQYTYMGAHVSRAARIEQITPPGTAYASAAFAALAAAEGVTDIRCEYVGQTRLPKGYGTFPAYHVRRG